MSINKNFAKTLWSDHVDWKNPKLQVHQQLQRRGKRQVRTRPGRIIFEHRGVGPEHQLFIDPHGQAQNRHPSQRGSHEIAQNHWCKGSNWIQVPNLSRSLPLADSLRRTYVKGASEKQEGLEIKGSNREISRVRKNKEGRTSVWGHQDAQRRFRGFGLCQLIL